MRKRGAPPHERDGGAVRVRWRVLETRREKGGGAGLGEGRRRWARRRLKNLGFLFI
jgi:hypothetical protein